MVLWGVLSPAPAGTGRYSQRPVKPKSCYVANPWALHTKAIYGDTQALPVSTCHLQVASERRNDRLLTPKPLLFIKIYFYVYVCILCVLRPWERPGEGAETSGAGVSGGCKPRDVGDEN